MEERLQKLLARAGYGSRRSCEKYITEGRVKVNGQIAELGQKADPRVDKILVDGEPLKLIDELTYIAIYKPRMVLSTVNADDPRQVVRDLVDVPGHLYPVGRLDLESEGLMLLTNDGELADRLTHPRYGHEKEYHVLVARRPDSDQLEAWQRGVVLEDGVRSRPAQVSVDGTSGKGAWLRVVMREGRKREIREIAQRLGLPIVKLIRVRIGTLKLGNMRPGDWRYLSEIEVRELGGTAELSKANRQAEKPDERFKKPERRYTRRPSPVGEHTTRRPPAYKRTNSQSPQKSHRPPSPGSKESYPDKHSTGKKQRQK